MALKLTNFASSTLAANLAPGDTTLSVQVGDAGKFATLGVGDWFPAVIVDNTLQREVVRVTARAGAVFTITRAQEGTAAGTFTSGARVDMRITAGALASLFEDPTLAAALALLLPKAGGTMTGPIVLSADPAAPLQPATKQYSDALDAATRAYVDGIAAGLGKRGRVRAATTGNIAIATALNNADTLDGVALANGDLVLVKDQTAPAENGIYVVGVTPVRSSEFDTYDEHPGSLLSVAEGTANADTLWLCVSNKGGTLGTTAITFSLVRIVAPATTDAAGIVELATTAETVGLADGTRAVVPSGLAPLLSGMIYGLTLANNAADDVNDIDVAAGVCIDTTNTSAAQLPARTKKLDANWAVGTAQGLRYSGAAIANGTYHIYAVWKAGGLDPDYYADPSANPVTALAHLQAEAGGAAYAFARRIGSIVRVGGVIRPFLQRGHIFTWKVPASDFNGGPPTVGTARALTVPTGIAVTALMNLFLLTGNTGGASRYLLLTSLAQPDTAPSASAFSVGANSDSAVDAGGSGGYAQVETNVAGEIRMHSTHGDCSVGINTYAYVDSRGALG